MAKLEFVGSAWHRSIEDLFDAIPLLAAQRMGTIEVGIGGTSFFDGTDAEEVEELVCCLKQAGLRVNSVHAPFGPDVDFSSFDDRVHERGVAAMIEAIEFTRALGARFTVIHPGDGVVTVNRAKRLDRSAGVIRELGVLAEASEVVLAVENLTPGYLCDEAEELLRLVRGARSDWVAVCFDTGHANAVGKFEETARLLLPDTVTLHIHDNDGSGDQHLFPGHGSIDWALFARLFHELCPNASIMVECAPPEGWDWPKVLVELGRMLAPVR